jgi:hypothetical protein
MNLHIITYHDIDLNILKSEIYLNFIKHTENVKGLNNR